MSEGVNHDSTSDKGINRVISGYASMGENPNKLYFLVLPDRVNQTDFNEGLVVISFIR